jgi:hypothetical protein
MQLLLAQLDGPTSSQRGPAFPRPLLAEVNIVTSMKPPSAVNALAWLIKPGVKMFSVKFDICDT